MLNLPSSIMSFLGLEGLHVFVTGAAGGIGREVVREFLSMFAEAIHSMLRHNRCLSVF